MTIFSKARTVGGEAGVPVTEVKSGRSNDFVDSGTKMLFALWTKVHEYEEWPINGNKTSWQCLGIQMVFLLWGWCNVKKMSEIVLGMVHELFNVQFVTVADLLRKIHWNERDDMSFINGVGSLQRRIICWFCYWIALFWTWRLFWKLMIVIISGCGWLVVVLIPVLVLCSRSSHSRWGKRRKGRFSKDAEVADIHDFGRVDVDFGPFNKDVDTNVATVALFRCTRKNTVEDMCVVVVHCCHRYPWGQSSSRQCFGWQWEFYFQGWRRHLPCQKWWREGRQQ